MSYKECVERDKRLKKLLRETEHYYGSGAWYDEEAGRIKKFSFSDNSKYPRYLKGRSARNYRRNYKNKDYLLQGNMYQKTFDYWWELY